MRFNLPFSSFYPSQLYLCNNAGQKYILRELRALFNFTEDESQKAQINLLDLVFRNYLPKAINRELNALRRNGVTGQDLFTHLVTIYHQHDLHKLSDRGARVGGNAASQAAYSTPARRHRQKSELKYQPIAAIVCSEELV